MRRDGPGLVNATTVGPFGDPWGLEEATTSRFPQRGQIIPPSPELLPGRYRRPFLHGGFRVNLRQAADARVRRVQQGRRRRCGGDAR